MTKQIQWLTRCLEFDNINNNNTTIIDWFSFQINDFFFQLSIRFKVDQIEKAINFSEITSTSVENFHGC